MTRLNARDGKAEHAKIEIDLTFSQVNKMFRFVDSPVFRALLQNSFYSLEKIEFNIETNKKL